MQVQSRREFIKASASLAIAGSLLGCGTATSSGTTPVYGHLWVYASRFPPDWDSTPILDEVFRDFKYAGIQGVELMEVNLRHENFVERAKLLIDQYGIPITGTSYNAPMWNIDEHERILDDAQVVIKRLNQVGGHTLGITVGDAGHKKTTAELDAQADLLRKIIKVCVDHKIEPNMHNHTFEVENDMHDLKGIIERIPDIKLGPDLNWLVRGGVDPVWFIQNYGKQMVYMHIRDQGADGKWTDAVGEGTIDFPAIAAALLKIGYRGGAAIELALDGPPIREVRESWKMSRDYVRNVFGW